MKPIYYSFIISILFYTQSFAQQKEGDIIMTKNFWGVKFTQDGRLLKPRKVLNIMQVNEEAYSSFKKAKSNYDAGVVLGTVGGFLIGWPIGTAIAGGDPEWGLAAAGGGLLLLSIPLNSAFNKHAQNAITIYNGSGPSASRVRVNVVPLGTGAKILVRF